MYLLLALRLKQSADEFWANEAAVGGAWQRTRVPADAVHVRAAGVLLRATMDQPGTLNLNNEVSTEV